MPLDIERDLILGKKAKTPRAFSPATLNHPLIERVIEAFPDGDDWTTFECCDLVAANPKQRSRRLLSWNRVSTSADAGVYAFLFPKRLFRASCTLVLYGPSTKGRPRQISFQLNASALPSPIEGHFVAYVGRSASLSHRLRLHFHATKKTSTAQVRKALEGCLHLKGHAARDFMLQHATVAYCRIPGDENVANRDIIEVALWAKFCTPFNIKSER
jgi:hypothetical protein